MKTRRFAWKVVLILLVFAPVAFIPASARPALLASRAAIMSGKGAKHISVMKLKRVGATPSHAVAMLSWMSPQEISRLNSDIFALKRGGESDVTKSLSTNHAVAIILTLVMLGCVVGFVEQSHD